MKRRNFEMSSDNFKEIGGSCKQPRFTFTVTFENQQTNELVSFHHPELMSTFPGFCDTTDSVIVKTIS